MWVARAVTRLAWGKSVLSTFPKLGAGVGLRVSSRGQSLGPNSNSVQNCSIIHCVTEPMGNMVPAIRGLSRVGGVSPQIASQWVIAREMERERRACVWLEDPRSSSERRSVKDKWDFDKQRSQEPEETGVKHGVGQQWNELGCANNDIWMGSRGALQGQREDSLLPSC